MTSFYGDPAPKTFVTTANGRSVLMDSTGNVVRDLGPAAGGSGSSQDYSPNIGLNPATGQYEYFTIGAGGAPVFQGVQAPPVNMHPGSSSSSSYNVSQSYSDPAALQLQRDQLAAQTQQAQQNYDLAVKTGDQQAQQAAQNELDRVKQASDSLAQQYAQMAQTGSYQNASLGLTASEGAANRAATASNQAAQQTFSGNQSALDRALSASNTAATYGLQQQQEQRAVTQANNEMYRQAQLDAVNNAQQYAQEVSLTDPAALPAFLAAGGGNASNAIAAGATGLSQNALLPAARTLEAIQNPHPMTPFSYNPTAYNPNLYGPSQFGGGQTVAPYATGSSQPGVVSTSWNNTPQGPQYVNNSNGFAAGVWDAGNRSNAAPNTGYTQPTASSAPGSMVFPTGQPAQTLPQPQQITQQSAQTTPMPAGAGVWAAGSASGASAAPGYAYGTDMPPIMRPRFATGTFEAGDATDPMDPAAGGAHPELIHLMDPPGADNARATVDPLVPPGTGPADDGGAGSSVDRLAGLFDSIAEMLRGASGGGMPPPPELGAPRFAEGTYDPTQTAATAADQPYIDQVRAQRTSVVEPSLFAGQVGDQTYNAKFGLQPTAIQDRVAQTRQDVYGLPTDVTLQQAQQYALQGSKGGYLRGNSLSQQGL